VEEKGDENGGMLQDYMHIESLLTSLPLKVYYASKDVSTEPLVQYHRHYFSKEHGCLDILDPSVMDALDNIIREATLCIGYIRRFTDEISCHSSLFLDYGEEEKRGIDATELHGYYRNGRVLHLLCGVIPPLYLL
jgi:hypothetical protein